MSIKYCFNQEIHKSFNLPYDFSTLVKDIKSIFVQKLPTNYLLQYEDADGDKIAITNDQEYRILVKQELPTVLSSVKIFVTSLCPHHMSDQRSTCTPKTNSEGSFEVVENENSLQLEEMESVDQAGEKDLDFKVIVSLPIPIDDQSKEEKKAQSNVRDKKDESFSSSASGKSGKNESRDLVEEMSLSMVEEQSYRDDESYTSKTNFSQALRIEEENRYSLDRIPIENNKKSAEIQQDTEKTTASLESLNQKENNSSNLSKYLSKINIKDSERSCDKINPILSPNQVLEDKYAEDSPERWISFSSQPEDTQFHQGLDFQRRDLFKFKQNPKSWFLCNQDRSYYREKEDEEATCNHPSMSKDPEQTKDCLDSFRESVQENIRYEQEENQERKGIYHGSEAKQVPSKQGSVEISFRENTDDFLQDIWFDLQSQVKSKINTVRNTSYQDLDLKIPPDEESLRDNGETMNISLLTASEAKRIASAIGSISRIEGVKKLKICTESSNRPKEGQTTQVKVSSPVCNRWACKRSAKLPGEEDWPFLKQPEATHNNKKEDLTVVQDKVHEGSFCMGCWRSPIKGVRYVCLICDDIEYCENCEVKIIHYHPLLKMREPIGALQDFMENLRSKFIQQNENAFPKGELSFKEDSVYKDMDVLGRSLERSLNFDNYQDPEKVRDEYKFEYKEISSTPLMIKSNKKEWCVVYKTISLRNIGNANWRRCHFEPIGIVPGTITEVSYVAPGDSVLITLEIHGFFAPGKYNSQWRVVHQSERDDLCEMGYINLEFEVVENRGNGFTGQETYEKEKDEELFYGKKLGPLDFY